MRIFLNVLLVRLGIRHILPSDCINDIKVVDNNEPMVQLLTGESVRTNGNTFIGRKGMIERLQKAADEVSEKGFCLHVYQTYRSPEAQCNRQKELYKKLKQKYPYLEEKDILSLLKKSVAGVGGGHQTGGAVDLGLCDKNGKAMDMGTQYKEHNNKTMTLCKNLSNKQRKNRLILLNAMQNADFVNYPVEWWHFSYGDKMWAAYSNKKIAVYDVI